MVTEPAPIPDLPLDPGLLELQEEEAKFFRVLTGIQSDEELKQHIVDVSAKAYQRHNYPCIRGFRFTKLGISQSPAYQRALGLRQERPDAILLDAACCFGNILRKAVLDGWPVENVIALDLDSTLWQYGHELFKSTPESFPAGFVCGDVFDSKIIQPREPFYEPPATPHPRGFLSLGSLMPLQGHISAIHASAFFHLFNEETQTELAKRFASLLSPEPGSVIFGGHRGTLVSTVTNDYQGYKMWCHSPESWRDLWDGQIFKKGTVRVDAVLEDVSGRDIPLDDGGRLYWLVWSVTRL